MKKILNRICAIVFTVCLTACMNEVSSSMSSSFENSNEIKEYLTVYSGYNMPMWFMGVQAKAQFEKEKSIDVFAGNYYVVDPERYSCNLSQQITISIERSIGKTRDDKSNKEVVKTINGTLADFFIYPKYNIDANSDFFSSDFFFFTDDIKASDFTQEESYLSYSMTFSSSDSQYLQIDDFKAPDDNYNALVGNVYWLILSKITGNSTTIKVNKNGDSISLESLQSKVDDSKVNF